MTTNTTNLGLVTYNSTTDASALFLTFRTDQAGVSATSNMGKIDMFAGIVTGSLATLVANKPVIPVSATYVSANYYEATVASITAYTTNIVIALDLDTTSDGTITLNINALGTKSLVKIDVDGNVSNFTNSELRKNKKYLFVYDGSQWVWIAGTSGDQISISGSTNNLLNISGCGVIVDSGISASSLAPTSGCYIVLGADSVLTNERVLKNGTATSISSSASEVSVGVILATVSQVTTGSANEAVISASALSSSDYGKRTVCIPLNTTSALLGSESAYIRIPSSMNLWKLVDVVATSGSSTSGSPAFRVAACPLNALSGSQNMLTTNPIIGQVAYDSSTGTGSTAAVINTSHAIVSTGTKVWAYSASASTCGSQVLWSEVHLTFQNTQ
jgi:hypothetical protein